MSLFTTGCSMDVAIRSGDLNRFPTAIGLTPSGNQNVITEDGYHAQVSMSTLNDGIATRTVSGYTVMTSFQGTLFDDDVISDFHRSQAVPAVSE
ncbi:hypothetical protein [Bdellovibrio sp. HCB274]|uniref:hypothetical protein n=1 Tax=Bdellovibrio sp. HCB274 TaxID=3394361 RepID=UPI0039B4F798